MATVFSKHELCMHTSYMYRYQVLRYMYKIQCTYSVFFILSTFNFQVVKCQVLTVDVYIVDCCGLKRRGAVRWPSVANHTTEYRSPQYGLTQCGKRPSQQIPRPRVSITVTSSGADSTQRHPPPIGSHDPSDKVHWKVMS